MTVSSNELQAPGAVQRSTLPKPIVWWLGGLGLVGAGALAASLVTASKSDTPPQPASTTVASTTSTTPAKVSKPAPTKLASAVCSNCGTVESVKSEKHKGEGTGLGAVGGAVLGGVVGHQLGGGNGKKALTVLGAVGGGLGGHEAEKQVRATTVYHVQMRMDDGSTRTVTQNTAPALGARFEVEGSQLKPLAAAKS
jgi:outer membrane lipoprotein SlyB